MEPVLQARKLVKRYGRVVAMDRADFELYPGEILAVIGDNGAGKSTLIKALSGAVQPDGGEILLDGKPVHFTSPIDAREAGIETVYQTLAMSPALSITDNMFMGRELKKPGFRGTWLRQLDRKKMEEIAREKLNELGLLTIQNINQAVETLSGGQRQGVAVARAAAFGSKVVIMDEPTAALGVKESRRVLELIKDVRARGLPIVLISHNMPHVFEVAGRKVIQRVPLAGLVGTNKGTGDTGFSTSPTQILILRRTERFVSKDGRQIQRSWPILRDGPMALLRMRWWFDEPLWGQRRHMQRAPLARLVETNKVAGDTGFSPLLPTPSS